MSKIDLKLIKVDHLSQSAVIDIIKNQFLKSVTPNLLVTPNAGHLKNIENNPSLREMYLNADLCLIDGWPIAVAASIASRKRINRITGSDILPKLFKEMTKDVRIGIIGGSNQKTIKSRLETDFPNLNIQIVDTSEWSDSIYDIRRLRELIQHNALSVVLLCLGHPKQELIAQQLKIYDWVGSRPDWIMCIGASIEFLTGEQKRSPKIFSKIGLEWIYRLMMNPKKFFTRYLSAIWPSIKLIIKAFTLRKIN